MDRYLKNLKYDIPAGLVVFLVALPLCLGIALASGAPLFSGIISGIVGGIVIGLASGSNLSVSGPAAGLTAIVLSAIATLGDYNTFLVAVVLAGIMQVTLGYLKGGLIGNYFPSSVIKGMLAAIGLILILKQIPHAFGYDQVFTGSESFIQEDSHTTFSGLFVMLNYVTPAAIILSSISLVILILWETKIFKKIQLFKIIPGELIVVVAGVLINGFFTQNYPDLALKGDHLVVLPSFANVAEISNFILFPNFSAIFQSKVWIVAITIALVASLESLLSVDATDKIDPDKNLTPKNRELKAQGLGNIFAGLLGGLPVTAVIVRSSANVSAGAKTKISAVFHGLLLLLSVLLIPNILNLIPLASLAAILLKVGYKLSKISLYKKMYQAGLEIFLPFIVTILAILLTDLLIGIIIGLTVSIFYILRNNYRTSHSYHKEETEDGHNITMTLSEDVSFLNKADIMLTLDNVPRNSYVIIDATRTVTMDYDVYDVIDDFKEKAEIRNIKLILIGFNKFNFSNQVKGH